MWMLEPLTTFCSVSVVVPTGSVAMPCCDSETNPLTLNGLRVAGYSSVPKRDNRVEVHRIAHVMTISGSIITPRVSAACRVDANVDADFCACF